MAGPMAEAPGVPSLTLHSSDQGERCLPLHGSVYRIGRDPGAELVVEQASVSRRHALLERRDGRWLLRDSGSTNGLWWQGRRVRELLLRHGDRIRLGPPDQPDLAELRFQQPAGRRRQRTAKLVVLALASLASAGLGALLLGTLLVPIRGTLATVRGPLLLYDRADRPIATADDRRHREQASLGG